MYAEDLAIGLSYEYSDEYEVPTRVGMDRRSDRSWRGPGRGPHARGDGPSVIEFYNNQRAAGSMVLTQLHRRGTRGGSGVA